MTKLLIILCLLCSCATDLDLAEEESQVQLFPCDLYPYTYFQHILPNDRFEAVTRWSEHCFRSDGWGLTGWIRREVYQTSTGTMLSTVTWSTPCQPCSPQ